MEALKRRATTLEQRIDRLDRRFSRREQRKGATAERQDMTDIRTQSRKHANTAVDGRLSMPVYRAALLDIRDSPHRLAVPSDADLA